MERLSEEPRKLLIWRGFEGRNFVAGCWLLGAGFKPLVLGGL